MLLQQAWQFLQTSIFFSPLPQIERDSHPGTWELFDYPSVPLLRSDEAAQCSNWKEFLHYMFNLFFLCNKCKDMANSGEGNSASATEVTSWNAYSTSMAILAGLNIFLAITASLGNALILIALHKVTSIYPPTKLLFRCLAVTDLLVGLNTQPIYVMILISSITKSRADRIVALEQYRGFWSGLLPLVSVLTLSAISVDRLLALSLGLRYRHTVTLRRVCAVIVGVWLLSALTYTGVIFFVNKIAYYFTRGTFIFLVIISVVISAFSYIKIFVSLRRQQAQIQQEQPYGARQNQLNIARYKKTVYTIAWVQLALLVCYAPYGIALLIGLAINIPHPSTETEVAWRALLTLLLSNSSFNPVLYCWKIRDVRQEVKNIFHEVCCCSY